MRFYDDDPVASVAVKAFDGADGVPNIAIITNGKSDGAIPGDAVTTILLALIPALLAREPANCFVVGYGTGVTAGELAALEEVAQGDRRRDLPGRDRGGAALRLRQPRRPPRTRRSRSCGATPTARCCAARGRST